MDAHAGVLGADARGAGAGRATAGAERDAATSAVDAGGGVPGVDRRADGKAGTGVVVEGRAGSGGRAGPSGRSARSGRFSGAGRACRAGRVTARTRVGMAGPPSLRVVRGRPAVGR